MCSFHFNLPEAAPYLTEEFDRLGLTDFFDGLDYSEDILNTVKKMWNRFDTAHQMIARLLIMGEAIELNRVQGTLVLSTLHVLDALGVLRKRAGKASLAGLSLARCRGVWLFADAPQHSPTLYFGPDSVGLARRLRPVTGGKALDLCSGPGIQGLILAQAGMTVTAVDVNPIASELCEFNAAVNGLNEKLSVVTGDLYDPIYLSERFDLIVANPPLLPIPSGIPYPFVGNGGPDGLDLTTRIISGAEGRLTSSGTILIVGMTLLKKGRILSFSKISKALEKAKLCGVISLLASFNTSYGSGYVQSVWKTAFASHALTESSGPYKGTETQVADGYRLLGADEASTFLLRAWPEEYEQISRLSVQDFSGTGYGQNPWRF